MIIFTNPENSPLIRPAFQSNIYMYIYIKKNYIYIYSIRITNQLMRCISAAEIFCYRLCMCVCAIAILFSILTYDTCVLCNIFHNFEGWSQYARPSAAVVGNTWARKCYRVRHVVRCASLSELTGPARLEDVHLAGVYLLTMAHNRIAGWQPDLHLSYNLTAKTVREWNNTTEHDRTRITDFINLPPRNACDFVVLNWEK